MPTRAAVAFLHVRPLPEPLGPEEPSFPRTLKGYMIAQPGLEEERDS